jgi:hypothetical protein
VFLCNKNQLDALIPQIYFGMKLYVFRRVPLSIIRNLFTVHSTVVYVIQVCRELSSRTCWSCSKAVYKPVQHRLLRSGQWINSWWWTEELSETRRVSCQNKFGKLVHLVGFYYKEICYDARSHERKKKKENPTCLWYFKRKVIWLQDICNGSEAFLDYFCIKRHCPIAIMQEFRSVRK